MLREMLGYGLMGPIPVLRRSNGRLIRWPHSTVLQSNLQRNIIP